MLVQKNRIFFVRVVSKYVRSLREEKVQGPPNPTSKSSSPFVALTQHLGNLVDENDSLFLDKLLCYYHSYSLVVNKIMLQQMKN